jgi:hypothetical protein
VPRELVPGPSRAPEAGPRWAPRSPLARALLAGAAFCSLVAALVHAQVVPEHMEQWWGYGWFFVVSAVAQLALAVLLALYAAGRTRALPAWLRNEPLAFAVGIGGNALLVLLYAWTRTVGNFVGPMAGSVEDVESLDLVSKAAEVLLVVALATLMLRRPVRRRA